MTIYPEVDEFVDKTRTHARLSWLIFLGKVLLMIVLVVLYFASNFKVLSGDVSVMVVGPIQEFKWTMSGWDVQKQTATINELAGTCKLYPDENQSGDYVGRCAKNWVLVPKTGSASIHIRQQTYIPDMQEKNKLILVVKEYDY